MPVELGDPPGEHENALPSADPSDANADASLLLHSVSSLYVSQKKRPSPLATALLLAVLRRLNDLAPTAAAVDVVALASSKGGRGTAVPPSS